MSLRGMPKASEAIPNGLASTMLSANYNDHASILGSVLLKAIPIPNGCLCEERSDVTIPNGLASMYSSISRMATKRNPLFNLI